MKPEPDQRYNLVFAGQLLPGTDPERARRTLAGFFGLKNTDAVDGFFRGQAVPLRRNLTRVDALRLYKQLRAVGLICEVPKAEKETPTPQGESPRGEEQTISSSPDGNLEKRHSPDSDPVKSAVATSTRTPAESTPKRAAQHPGTTAKRPKPRETPAPQEREPDRENQTRSRDSSGTEKSPLRGKAPNLFALRPAATRPQQALLQSLQLRALVATAVALALCILVIAIVVRFPAQPVGEEPRGPLATSAVAGNRLLMMLPGVLLLHERSGLPRQRIEASELGLSSLAPPLSADQEGFVYLTGSGEDGLARYLRCDLDEGHCSPVLKNTSQTRILARAHSYLGDRQYLLADSGELLLSDTQGTELARAAVQLPWGQARLVAHNGLLLVPAAEGPLLGVYRPDDKRFGQQLDALLLMPDGAVGAGQDRIQDIITADDHHWAILQGASTTAGLYRFDSRWGQGTSIPATLGSNAYLSRWRNVVLVASAEDPRVQRFTQAGVREADFVSSMLDDERQRWQTQTQLRAQLRRFGVALPLLLAAVGALLALLAGVSIRALQSLPDGRTALLDPLPSGIHWLADAPTRDTKIRQLGVLLVGSAVLAASSFWLLFGGFHALCFLPALLGSVGAWTAFHSGKGGHIGMLKEHAVLVDHDGRYFYGEQASLRTAHGWLVAPDVAVPLRSFGLDNLMGTLNSGDITIITSSALFGALRLTRHPWLRGWLLVLGGWLLSALLLLAI